MKTKEYMNQARYLDMRIDSKLEQIASLNDLAIKCTSTITDMPRNPNHGGSSMEDIIVKIVDLQEEINKDIDTLVDVKKEMICVIKSIHNVEYQTLLEKRYLCFESWGKIAGDMNHSIQHTFRIHDKALKEIDEILKSGE